MPERIGQSWIMDSLVGSMGLDVVFPDADVGWLDHGMKLQDYRRTMQRVRSASMLPKAWCQTADGLASKAVEAETRGYRVTACELYHRAAFCYSKAFWAAKMPDLHIRLKDAFARAAEYAEYEIEIVRIPFEGHAIHGVLHLPDKGVRPAPCIIFVPGMDNNKEDYPNLQNNVFTRRGAACLSIDGPGQGETWLGGLYVTPDNYAEAGSAAIDFLEAHPAIESSSIATFGISMGSYWAPTIAAIDSRVSACVAVLGCYMQKRTIFTKAPPSFRYNFMAMANLFDDAAFNAMVEQMTLSRFAHNISCPTLLAQGEFDQLCPLEDARELLQLLTCPRELWVFENEFHGIGRQRGELFSMAADWVLDALAGKLPDDVSGREVWMREPN